MMYGEAIWKYGTGEIAKPSSAIAPEPHKKVGWRGRVTAPDMNLQLHKRSVMAYGHKTQSFMENGGQQICLGKALLFNFKGKFLNMCQYGGGEVCGENATQIQVNSFQLFGVKAFYK